MGENRVKETWDAGTSGQSSSSVLKQRQTGAVPMWMQARFFSAFQGRWFSAADRDLYLLVQGFGNLFLHQKCIFVIIELAFLTAFRFTASFASFVLL